MTVTPFLLRPARDHEIDHIRTLNSEMWAKDLDVETYHERERTIGSVTLTRDGGIRCWVLVNPESDQPDDVLSSCETIRKHTIISRPPVNGQKTCNLTETEAHSIGCVYTPKQHRGRGYAGIMLKLLADYLMKENERGFSVLYSDIGKKFYAKYGWQPHRAAHIEFPVVDAKPTDDVRYLRSSDLQALCSKDIKALRDKLLQPASHVRIAFLPDWKTMEWHHAREEFVARHVRPHMKTKPELKGAITADGKRWIVWNRDFMGEEPTLFILRVASLSSDKDAEESAREFAKLFCAALSEAKKWGLNKIVLWNPEEAAIRGARLVAGEKVNFIERDSESIPSLMMHKGDSSAQDVEWVGNEKYAWC